MGDSQRNLVVDRGNTFTKAMLFQGAEIINKYDQLPDKKLVQFVKEEKPDSILISSVKKGSRKICKALNKYASAELLTYKMALPFTNLYNTPETLGMDRVANVAGAYYLHPGQNCLVIDAGTCITYDFIDASGKYHGGSISPGINMRFRALKKFTSRLPLIAFKKEADLIGKSTKSSILSGVVNGVIGEVEGVIGQYRQFFDELIIIICGGDSNFFESKLKGHIFAEPDLLLIGLNRILLYNAE